MLEMTHQEKLDYYSAAEPKDIGTKAWQQVRNGILWKGFVGTVFGEPVSTSKGVYFDSRQEAKKNAQFFVDEVRNANGKH